MADIQKQFMQFDDNIRLKRFGENKTLREKRDAILDRLRDKFKAMREEDEEVPSFSTFNQGSYEMGTGIQPADGDYDIDVAVCFNCSKDDYPNPVDLKELVANALKGHTELGTEVRRSCVTVYYKLNGEQAYHVDLAIYAYDDPESEHKRLFLAKGKLHSDEQNRWWEKSDPQGFSDWVDKRFTTREEQEQFLRVIRALKRWKTEKFKTDGNNAPPGIGLTVAAGLWFKPQVVRDTFANKTTFDDLKAMRLFVGELVSHFVPAGTKEDGATLYRLIVPLPVVPHQDVFEKMTVGQMTTCRERLVQLKDCLEQVRQEPDPVEACKALRKHFGEEFPIPEKEDTAKSLGRAVSSSGVSA